MTYNVNKIAVFVSIFLALGALSVEGQESVKRDHRAKRSILVVHDLGDNSAKSPFTLQNLKDTLWHFDAALTATYYKQYTPGLMRDFDIIFYVGAKEHSVAELDVFLQDMLRFHEEKVVCWINEGAEEYLSLSGDKERFRVKKPNADYDTLIYKGVDLTSAPRRPHRIDTKDHKGDSLAFYGMFRNAEEETPFALNIGKLWYFSILPENEDDYLVFCDILHLALLEGKEHNAKPGKMAFFVLEGVNPTTDVKEFAKTSGAFIETGSPFMVGIAPTQRTARGKSALSTNHYLLRNIHSVIASNGTILLQADTVTTDKGINEQAVELIQNDIFPLAFLDAGQTQKQGPGYPIENHFSTLVEPRRIPFFSHDNKFQTIVPIATKLSQKQGEAGYPDAYLEAKRRSVLRDAALGFVVKVGLEKKELKKLIKGLKKMGYALLDLRYRPNFVRTDRALIVSEPSYYERIPIDTIVYGDKTKMELVKFHMTDNFLVEKFFSHNFKLKSEKAYALRLKGTALIDIPNRWGIFIAEKTDEKTGAVEKLEKPLLALLLGKGTKNLKEDVYRVIVLSLFVVTILLLIYLLWMFFFEEWVRKTFRGI